MEPVGRGDRLVSAREALREAEAGAQARDAEQLQLSGGVATAMVGWRLDDVDNEPETARR